MRKKRIKSSFKRNFGLGMSRLKFFTVLLAMSFLIVGCGSSGGNKTARDTSYRSNFMDGSTRLDCGVSCALKYGYARDDLKKLFNQKDWRRLGNKVVELNHPSDQAYFYLGYASEQLNRLDSAKKYYQIALYEEKCDGILNVCDGLDVNALIQAGLDRLDNTYRDGFLNGAARLNCGLSCAMHYKYARDDLLKLYQQKEWKRLANKVLELGYASNQSYFYLGASAEKLNRHSAAKTYYRLALHEDRCNDSSSLCDGLDVSALIQLGLNRIEKKERQASKERKSFFGSLVSKQEPKSAATKPSGPAIKFNLDTVPPVLNILGGQNISFSESVYNLSGSAFDAGGIAEVSINGQRVNVDSAGKFNFRRYYPIGETQLNIAAIDTDGNRSSQTIILLREGKSLKGLTTSDAALGAPDKKSLENRNAIALIIGIDEYSSVPRAKHAENDARLFYDYANTSLGIPADRIKLLTGNKASRADIFSAVSVWLKSLVIENETDVMLYFAGHGLATPNGEDTYLLTHDSRPNIIEYTALNRDFLLQEIAKTKPKSTLVFLDTCYSGSGRGGESNLVADSRALVIRPRDIKAPEGFSLFSAASGSQLANSHPQQKNGLFSYYVMRGLNDEADANKDDQLTASELQQYVLSNVKRSANFYGRPQTPELTGDATRVIADWRKSGPSKKSKIKSYFKKFFD